MTLIVIIDVLVVILLVGLTLAKGLEGALPFFAFVVVLAPDQSAIPLGMFDLTTQRVALITLIALYLTFRKRPRAEHKPRRIPLKYLMLLSVVWLALSCLNSVVPVMSLKVVLSEVIEYYILYLILMRTISDTRTIHRIMYGIVAALMVCSILGLGEMHYIWDVSTWFPAQAQRFAAATEPSQRGLRIQATFPHPIHYGAALAIAIPLALYLISVSESATKRAFLWVGILLMFYNIYKTESRGPWLALALSLACVFFLCQKKLRRYILGIAFLTCIALIARPGVLQSLVNNYYATTNINTTEGASYYYRYALFRVSQQALDQRVTRAVWGYGPESFYFLNLRGDFLGRSDWLFLSCDSTWIEFMVETGYVGLFIMALLLLTPAFRTFRDYRRIASPANHLSGVLFTSMAAFYFMMISVAMYAWGQIGYLLWMLIAMSLAYGELMQNGQQVSVPDHYDISVPTGELSFAKE